MQQCLQTLRPDTVKQYVQGLQSGFTFLTATGRRADDPMDGFDRKAARAAAKQVVAYSRPTRRRTLSPQVESLLAEWTSTLVAAGMRPGTITTRIRCVRTFGHRPDIDLLAATPAQLVEWLSAPELKAWFVGGGLHAVIPDVLGVMTGVLEEGREAWWEVVVEQQPHADGRSGRCRSRSSSAA